MMAADDSKCAACGKRGDGLKTCAACKMVKYYCNATCQKAHRPKHKKACKKRAADIFDEALFEDHRNEDCPICLLPILHVSQTTYKSCCGKSICNGCIYTMVTDAYQGEEVSPLFSLDACPFCRKPSPSSNEEDLERIKKRMQHGDAGAFEQLGISYNSGTRGLRKDYLKALDLWLRAKELGCNRVNYYIGNAYHRGRGVEKDVKKTKYHWELAAISGQIDSRHNLGFLEKDSGNVSRAMKHFIIAARAGFEPSLEYVKRGFFNGEATKDEYERALRGYQEIRDEAKSHMRDLAALADAQSNP